MSDGFTMSSLSGVRIHMTGIKGTGMAALAELLNARGALITGSDTSEKFYTDEALDRAGIPYNESFEARHILPDTRLVIYSAAYHPEENPELVRARELGIPIAVYTDALGLLSRLSDSSGVAGVHGKTTTTAMVGTILKALDVPASVLAGASVPSFGDASTMRAGEQYFVAETCEYRRHFLSFQPRRIVVTSVEPDHLDYFRDLADVMSAFLEYARKLPDDGALIVCADDAGAAELSRRFSAERPNVRTVPYGVTAAGRFRVSDIVQEPGRTRFRVAIGDGIPFAVRVPGRHSVLNAAAALALSTLIVEDARGRPIVSSEVAAMADALERFSGSRRRSEIVADVGGVLIMDDYGHHPTAIRTTIAGLRAFYPGRRIVVDFMSHTYSRTRALLDEFATAFADADEVILHEIYASAREKRGDVSGRDLYDRVRANHPQVAYFPTVDEALPYCESELRPGDLFLTMGAGNNWTLGRDLAKSLSKASSPA